MNSMWTAIAIAIAKQTAPGWDVEKIVENFEAHRCVQFQITHDEDDVPSVRWGIVWRLTEQLNEIEVGGRAASRTARRGDTIETIERDAYAADRRLVSMSFIEFLESGR